MYISGCSESAKPKGFPDKLYPCEITITAEAIPLEGARVELIYQNANQKNWASTGITDTKGIVEFYTYGKWKGVPSGSFKVVVVKQMSEGKEGNEIVYNLIDPQYSESITTPLLLEVKNKTTATFDVGKIIKQKVKN